MRAVILQPTKKTDRSGDSRLPAGGKGGYVWPGITVKQSPGKGYGVYATRSLKVGTLIPILGKRVAIDKQGTHGWQYYGKSGGAISGNPSIHPFKHVGCFGLAVAMMLNEDTEGPLNCKFKLDHICVARPIKKGEELTVDYGNAYEPIRKIKRYTMSNNKHRFDSTPQYDQLKYPSAKVRNNNIKKWNTVITRLESATLPGRSVTGDKKIKKTGRRVTKQELRELKVLKGKKTGQRVTQKELRELKGKKTGRRVTKQELRELKLLKGKKTGRRVTKQELRELKVLKGKKTGQRVTQKELRELKGKKTGRRVTKQELRELKLLKGKKTGRRVTQKELRELKVLKGKKVSVSPKRPERDSDQALC